MNTEDKKDQTPSPIKLTTTDEIVTTCAAITEASRDALVDLLNYGPNGAMQPGLMRQHILGDKPVTPEMLDRQIEARRREPSKLAFKASQVSSDEHEILRDPLRPMPVRIMGLDEIRRIETVQTWPVSREVKRARNTSWRRDKKELAKRIVPGDVFEGSYVVKHTRSVWIGHFHHTHKGGKPKRGNPYRRI